MFKQASINSNVGYEKLVTNFIDFSRLNQEGGVEKLTENLFVLCKLEGLVHPKEDFI